LFASDINIFITKVSLFISDFWNNNTATVYTAHEDLQWDVSFVLSVNRDRNWRVQLHTHLSSGSNSDMCGGKFCFRTAVYLYLFYIGAWRVTLFNITKTTSHISQRGQYWTLKKQPCLNISASSYHHLFRIQARGSGFHYLFSVTTVGLSTACI
jgi:hypothetical protein